MQKINSKIQFLKADSYQLKAVRGFTLIEVLIVMSVIVILSYTVLFYLNPFNQIARANNSKRLANVSSILIAVERRAGDNRGIFETGCAAGPIPSVLTNIGSGAGKYNIASCLVPAYLQVMPYDPKGGAASDTGYQIAKDSSGLITVAAPWAELGAVISVTRK